MKEAPAIARAIATGSNQSNVSESQVIGYLGMDEPVGADRDRVSPLDHVTVAKSMARDADSAAVITWMS